MTTLYLSLTDHTAAEARRALSAAISAMPSDTDAEYKAMRDACARWAAMRTTVQEQCPRCGAAHDALWTVRRVPIGTLGHFTVYRLNGGTIVPDASLPYTTDRLPRDAARVPADRAAALWHDASGSHVFGGPDVGAMLRATIAAANGARP